MSEFSGFSRKFFSFLEDLTRNNRRDWFNENKTRYRDEVVAPTLAFIAAMSGPLKTISPYMVADARPQGGSMFRIYRDTRFSKSKRPYKENVGCQFRHETGRNAHAPGFYLHLAPREVFLGAGMWRPDSSSVNRNRQRLIEKTAEWRKILHDKTICCEYQLHRDDSLKRVPRGYDPTFEYADDLKLKSFIAIKKLKKRDVSSASLVEFATQSFSAAVPFMRF